MFSSAHQAWRLHPALRQSENLKRAFPGFGTAAVIFSAYMFGEALYNQLSTNRASAAAAATAGRHMDRANATGAEASSSAAH